jgi:hypothetical protein
LAEPASGTPAFCCAGLLPQVAAAARNRFLHQPDVRSTSLDDILCSGSILDIDRVKAFCGCYIRFFDSHTASIFDSNCLTACASGCKDTQTSADACIGGQRCGAMTFCLLQVMHHTPEQLVTSAAECLRLRSI